MVSHLPPGVEMPPIPGGTLTWSKAEDWRKMWLWAVAASFFPRFATEALRKLSTELFILLSVTHWLTMSHDPQAPLPPAEGPQENAHPGEPLPAEGQAVQQRSEEAGLSGQAQETSGEASESDRSARPRILIGSQRDPAAYRPRPGKPVSPVRPRPSLPETPGPARKIPTETERTGEPGVSVHERPGDVAGREAAASQLAGAATPGSMEFSTQEAVAARAAEESSPTIASPGEQPEEPRRLTPAVSASLLAEEEEPPPEKILSQEIDQLREQVKETAQILAREGTQELFNRRLGLPPDLQKEFEEAVGDLPVEQLIDQSSAKVKVGLLEPESRHVGKVLAVRGENVFVELGLREQGLVPLKLFREPPEVGQSVEVRVVRFVPEEGVYELVLPAAAADVADWSDLTEGMLVEARVTGVNQGGLECEVNRIRGFIPISQIDIFRVEKPEEYVGQSFTCVVLEADPQRKNLVLSRRAVLEREREQAQRILWDSLAPGQIRDGVVRRLTEFGAFVDLGGVDGLLHISQIAWGRIKHPSEVLREGQPIKVRIDKVDRENQRISLGYRDLLSNPWEDAEKKYLPQTLWKGRVTRLMDFGAFVELEPGVEGLVHISELALKRVSRVSDVVKVGDEVEVMVLSFEPQERRLSLSIRAALKAREPEPAPAETTQQTSQVEEPPAPPPVPKKPKPQKPLKGGLGSSPGGSLMDLLKK